MATLKVALNYSAHTICYLLQQQQIKVNRQMSIRVGLGRC